MYAPNAIHMLTRSLYISMSLIFLVEQQLTKFRLLVSTQGYELVPWAWWGPPRTPSSTVVWCYYLQASEG